MGSQHDCLKTFLRMRLDREGITRNVGFVLILGSLLVIAATAFLLTRSASRRNAKWMQAYGTTLTHVLSRVAVPYFTSHHSDALQAIVRQLNEPHVRYCMVVDTDQRIVAHTDEHQRGQRFTPPDANIQTVLGLHMQRYAAADHGHVRWHFSMPINTALKQVGTLHLELTSATTPMGTWLLTEEFALVALLVFLLVPLVYYCLRAWLRPLRHLNDEIKRLADAKQIAPLEVISAGEIGELEKTCKQVFAHLQEERHRIAEANFELELTVNVLAYEKRRLAVILNRLSDAILITDASGSVSFANKITERFLNMPIDDIIGRPLKECFSHEIMTGFIEENEEIMQTMTVRSVEVSLDLYNTEIFKVSYSSLVDEEEHLIGGFLLIRNITQQKMSEQAKSEFVSAVSHEIKNPLTTIKSYIDLLINQMVDDNETKYEFYNTINDETDRMVRLIDNLLNLSKIELGSLQLKPGRVRMKQLLTDCCQAVETQALAKDIKFDVRIPEKFPTLEGDKDLLGTIMMNLLSNALKYTPAGGTVSVVAEEAEDEVCIQVRDTGIGIPEADLPRVFERFYRAENGALAQSGSGLGLALAQQIAQLHGGTINVVSQVNQGSQFTVVLPNTESGTQLIGAGRYHREDSDY